MRVAIRLANTPYNLADLMSNPGAPTIGLVGTPAAGNVDNGGHRYAITFVTGGVESAIGAQSSTVYVVDKTVNGQVRLVNIPLGPTGTTARKVYRTSANNGLSYKLQSTIADNTTTVLTDNTADASLTGTAIAGPFSQVDDKPPFFSDLILNGDAANAGAVFMDIGNPGINATNYGSSIGTTGSVRIEGGPPVMPGNIWLFATTAEQYLEVSGRPF
jgi:hypothetical protein